MDIHWPNQYTENISKFITRAFSIRSTSRFQQEMDRQGTIQQIQTNRRRN
jgi:hypothetical protein